MKPGAGNETEVQPLTHEKQKDFFSPCSQRGPNCGLIPRSCQISDACEAPVRQSERALCPVRFQTRPSHLMDAGIHQMRPTRVGEHRHQWHPHRIVEPVRIQVSPVSRAERRHCRYQLVQPDRSLRSTAHSRSMQSQPWRIENLGLPHRPSRGVCAPPQGLVRGACRQSRRGDLR